MAESLFKMFDTDKSGALNFYEFMHLKNSSMKKNEEKLNWIFQTFDKNCDGVIDNQEFHATVKALLKMVKRANDDETVKKIVEEIKGAVSSESEVMCRESFMAFAMNSSFIQEMVYGYCKQLQ